MRIAMRTTSVAGVLAAALVTAALIVATVPVAGQDDETFPLPGSDLPLDGYTRTDGTIVLSDEAFCRFLLGSLWEGQELTFAQLLDSSKKQKRARSAAFEPSTDVATLERCAQIIGAFRAELPKDDTVAAWARRSPVVPEALAPLLPPDFEARPLATPDEIGPAARTSGFGDTVSAPFEMSAETWLAEVDAVDCREWHASLRDARDAEKVIELTGIREYLYGVDPGTYYWQVTAPGCDWSVDLVPIELGPDPDAIGEGRVPVPKLHGETWGVAQPNPDYLTVTQARQALIDAGLVVGSCTEEPQRLVDAGRIWRQEPISGTLVEPGTPVDVWATSDCDVFLGERIILD